MKAPRRSHFILPLLAVVLAAGGYYWWHGSNNSTDASAAAPLPAQSGRSAVTIPVQAVAARRESVPHYLNGLGTVTSANTVTLRSRVDGDLVAIHFTEGQQVSAGQLLAEVDPRPFKVALMQAQGQLAKDRATLTNARRDLARFLQLAKTGLVSQQERDAQQAKVDEILGTIKTDEANVAKAELDLSWSRVSAPVAGRVGLRQVDVGNYITSSDSNGIVVITQTHPIDVLFTLPESDIARVLNAQKAGRVAVDAWDRSNKQLVASGTLLSLDNQIDATTGTVKLKARFSNQDDRLFPNQFVNVRLKAGMIEDAIVVPPAAIQSGSEGSVVWVVNQENKVHKKAVTTGLQDSQRVVIAGGLNAGERVVTDGIDRLTDDARVEVVAAQNSAEPAQPAAGAQH